MPDALNHLSAFNRIALALENLPEDDLTSLIEAITAIANKTIPVADMTAVASAIANKTIPVTNVDALATKLDTLNTTLSNLSLGGVGGTGGSLDCNCLADALKPLIDKIDQMVCVIVPIANSQHQIEKAITYVMRDGPQYGIDAPPGTFIWPVPGDYAPPLPYTPWPGSDTPTDSTGAWIAPPIINGIYYEAPPGGMQGKDDETAYNDYKCNVANFIFDYLIEWMNWLQTKANDIGVGMLVNDMVLWLIEVRLTFAAVHGASTAISATAGVSLIKGTAASLTVLVLEALLIFCGELLALAAELYWAQNRVADWITVMQAAKPDIICALWKAKSVGGAREAVMLAITNHYTLYFSFLPNFLKEGVMGRLTRLILSDNLLGNLFASQEGWSAADFGTATTPCTNCLLCKDMDEAVLVNQKSVFGYPAQPPAIEIRTGLTAWPITVDLGTIDSDALCLVGRSVWINGGSVVKITQNGTDLGNWAWAGWTDTGAGNNSTLASMPFKETLFYPKLPSTRFTGHVVMEVHNEGATWKTEYEVQSVSWRLPTP